VNTKLDIRVIIDGYLNARKYLVGVPAWIEDQDKGIWLWSRPLEINGEQPGINLIVKSYPSEKPTKFRIILTAPKCIWRLDIANDAHLNPLSAPHNPGIFIDKPHYHSWSDNRGFATANSLPNKLKNARVLDENLRSFDNAFRWFCAQIGVVIVTAEIPALPKPGKLL
jgi:hypothetical protein